VVEYLHKYESIFETALALESMVPGVFFGEKTRGRISREAITLKSKDCTVHASYLDKEP
jgi:hypothetical protein